MNYYHQCRGGIGKPVEIRTVDGRIHRGIIHRVDNRRVYLRPMPGRNYGGIGYPYYGGFGYPYYGGWGWGWGWGLGFGVALGAIASLAFLGLFW